MDSDRTDQLHRTDELHRRPSLEPADPARVPATGTSLATGTSPATGSPLLVPLTSIRFFAALHIFVFHIQAMHRGAGDEMSFPAFDTMPIAISRLIERGYYSTSLFFLLSGFVLAYLYIGRDHRMTMPKRDFWIARLIRIYPLHLVVMLLVVPVALMMSQGRASTLLLSGLCNALLVQAWVPPYALSWNFPTWALSTVVFFYLAFPLVVSLTGNMSKRLLAASLLILPLVSLLPTLVFLWQGGEARFPTMSFWNEFVMRTPLFWLPHFAMGVILSRLLGISRFLNDWRDSKRRRLAWGDLAFAAVLVLLVVDQTWPLAERTISPPNFIMRHGALTPLYLVMIADLARNRGILSWLLDRKFLRVLGDSSFSIFMLQTPAIVIMVIASSLGLTRYPLLQLLLTVGLCLALSLLSTRFFEKPVARKLRERWIPSSKPTRSPIPAPHGSLEQTPNAAPVDGVR